MSLINLVTHFYTMPILFIMKYKRLCKHIVCNSAFSICDIPPYLGLIKERERCA